jgi:hypothetical protein
VITDFRAKKTDHITFSLRRLVLSCRAFGENLSLAFQNCYRRMIQARLTLFSALVALILSHTVIDDLPSPRFRRLCFIRRYSRQTRRTSPTRFVDSTITRLNRVREDVYHLDLLFRPR